MRWKSIVCCGAFALALFATPASAAPITGVLNITGAANVTADTIDWIPLDGGIGEFVIVFPSSGYFAGIDIPVNDNTGDSLDLPAGPFPVGGFLDNFFRDHFRHFFDRRHLEAGVAIFRSRLFDRDAAVVFLDGFGILDLGLGRILRFRGTLFNLRRRRHCPIG